MSHARDQRCATRTPSACYVRRMLWYALCLSALCLSACRGGGPSDSQTAAPPAPNPSFTNTVTPGIVISGVASKGPLVGAQIPIFVLTADGRRGEAIAGHPVADAIVTQADGSWTTTLPPHLPGPFLLSATGGEYIDETTGTATRLDPTVAVRLTGDMALFRGNQSALHITATEMITMGIVEITTGALDLAQGTLSIEGERVTLRDHPDALRQGVQVILERTEDRLALITGTIAIPADASGGGTITLRVGAAEP